MITPRESGFSFGGKRCEEFGCLWMPDDEMQVAPEYERNEYELPGVRGTLLVGEGESYDALKAETMEISGRLVFKDEPRTHMEAMRRLRAVRTWLSGRKRLIWDAEPDVYYMAQIDEAMTYTYKNWFGGELEITWKIMPVAYSTAPLIYTGQISYANVTTYEAWLPAGTPDTGLPIQWRLTLDPSSVWESCVLYNADGSTQPIAISRREAITVYSELPALSDDGTSTRVLRRPIELVDHEGVPCVHLAFTFYSESPTGTIDWEIWGRRRY